MKLTRESKIITFLYLIELALWVYLTINTKHTSATEGFLFDYILKAFLLVGETMFVLGGLLGLTKAIKWGGIRSVMGRAVSLISAGLISWGVGGFIWSWYLFYAKVEIPYPSLADLGFVLALPLWSLGAISLSKAIGAKFGLRKVSGKFILLLVPLLVMILSYYLLVVIARGGVIDFSTNKMQLFFDLAYPLGDVLIFTVVGIVYLLSNRFLGGRYQKPVFFLFIGFILMYAADFIFSFTTTNGAYFNAHFVDMLFATAIWVLSISVNNLDPQIKD